MEESEKKSMISNKYVALFVVGFFVYIALMILIAYLTSRKGSTKGEDYLMGGRNVGLLLRDFFKSCVNLLSGVK